MRSWSPFVVLALVLAASSALAEGVPAASPPPPPPPGGYPPPPPPPPGYYVPPPGAYAYVPPPPNPSIHNHDGFYLCLALGGGYVSDSESASISGFSSQDYKITGGGVIGEIKLGGTPGRGLVVGGGVEFGAFPSPSVKAGNGVSSTGTSQTLNVSTIGPFVDYYFDPSQGLHLQALIGYGVLSVSSKDGSSSSSSGGNPSGLALSLGFGDEWWVGEQWSIGVLARLQYVNAKRSETILGTTISDSNSVVVPGLLATFTNH